MPTILNIFKTKGEGFTSLALPPSFVDILKRIDDGTDAGGINIGNGLKIENQQNVPAVKGGLKRILKLGDRLSAYEPPF